MSKLSNKQRIFELISKLDPDFNNVKEKPKLIITVGISGSGKSTWINSYSKNGFVIISPDNIRKELSGNINNQTINKEVFTLAFDRIIKLLNSGKNVIYDATNVSSKERIIMINTIKDGVNRDFDAFAKIFNSDPEVSKKRIASDINNGIDRTNVPDDIIDIQYKLFINDLHKLESEGFKVIK